MNEYERKFQAAISELEKTDIWRSNYAPPASRVQRRLGQEVRPPHYASFWRVASGYGFWFAGIWGIIMWLTQWRAQGLPVSAAIASAALAGAMFGLILAAYYARSRRKYGLSRWEDL